MTLATWNQSSKEKTISHRALYALYLVVPVTLGLVALDELWWGGWLKTLLPRSPDHLRVFTVFFVFPHIFASFHGFFDSEYLAYYRRPLIFALVASAALAFGSYYLLGALVQAFFMAVYTNYHVVAQQIGINLMYWGAPTRAYKTWRWSFILISLVLYIPLYGQLSTFLYTPTPTERILTEVIRDLYASPIAYAAFKILIALFLVLTLYIVKASRSGIGRAFVGLNTLMLFSVLVFAALRYPFFAIFVPRVIHDISGFFFYVTHDHNRALASKTNVAYRFLSRLGLPIFILSPIAAILLANGVPYLLFYFQFSSVFLLMMMLNYMHYIMEGYIWRRGSPHRNHIRIDLPSSVLTGK